MSLPRLLVGVQPHRALSLAEHRALHPTPTVRGAELVEAARLAGLRGRGGASFPTATKLLGVAREPGPRLVLVNGAEGEPMSAKDRVLLHLAPHLVLDGALAAADVVGARRVVVAIRADAADALGAMRDAVVERSAGRLVKVVSVPGVYLAGEESALIRHLDGGPLKPTVVPPLPSQRGLRRRPTLVQNPETLAHLALIGRHGAAWFREVGMEDHPGSALVTVSGAVARPGVQEIACGTPLDDVLARSGGPTERLRAVLIGGYHGTWIPSDAIAAATMDDQGLAPHGASLAAGVIVALGESACPARELAQTMTWLAGQISHQCGPCTNGLPALAAVVSAMVEGRARPEDERRVPRWISHLPGRGACHLPDGAMRFLSSALRVFAPEIADHRQHGPCPACTQPATLVSPAARRAAA